MKKSISIIFKGIGIGVANVIPGVSGGTIALITGIFERLIDAIKSFDLKAIRLLLKGNLKEFLAYTDLVFLIQVFAGVFIAVASIAKLFDFLFEHYPIYIWSYFFGLILASVYFVGRTIRTWSISVFVSLLLGTIVAIILSFMNPATQNDSFLYLMFCGVAAICSMILPGLSGSFILILMGNYQLVVIDAVNQLNLDILLPVMIGAVVGLIGFSHFLSWIFKKFKDQTIAVLTGFILGSISILWPWKHELFMLNSSGEQVLKKGEPIITGYQRYIPEAFTVEVLIAIGLILIGIVSIWLLELKAGKEE